MPTLPVKRWSNRADAQFMLVSTSQPVAIWDKKQLVSAVLLYNTNGLEYYKLFNRMATASISAKIILGASIDLGKSYWLPFDQFRAEFDGNGKTITGLKLEEEDVQAQGFIAENFGKIYNLTLNDAEVITGNQLGIIAGVNRQEGRITSVS